MLSLLSCAPAPSWHTVGAVVAVVAALVGVYVKRKAKKPPASAGGGRAQGGVTLSTPSQSANAAGATATTEAAEKASAEQAAVAEVFTGKQVATWLTERCGINASDAKLQADALAELGVDTPEDLHLIDGDEVPWPSVVKPEDRKKIQAGSRARARCHSGARCRARSRLRRRRRDQLFERVF